MVERWNSFWDGPFSRTSSGCLLPFNGCTLFAGAIPPSPSYDGLLGFGDLFFEEATQHFAVDEGCIQDLQFQHPPPTDPIKGWWYRLDLPPTQDSSGKWRFRLGFPTKNVTILVVTVTGCGVDLRYRYISSKSTMKLWVNINHLSHGSVWSPQNGYFNDPCSK